MSTTISVLGGVGRFLLGMSVMTAGLKGLAGSRLRTVLSEATLPPYPVLFGAPWSRSAHFARAVGLDQACALVIGRNIGTSHR